MPEKKTKERADRKRRQGQSASSQAGEYVREEIHHVREGKHGARSAEQIIAIGLSKARRAGVKLKPPPGGKRSTRRKAAQDASRGRSAARSRGALRKLQREGREAASHEALSRHARSAARRGASGRRRSSPRRKGSSAS